MAIEQQRLARPNPSSGPFGVENASGIGATAPSGGAVASLNPLQLFLGNLLGGSGGGVNIANLIQQLRGMGIPGLPDIGQGWVGPGSSSNAGIGMAGTASGMPATTPSTATPPLANILPQTAASNPSVVPSPWTNLPMMGLGGGSGMVLG